MIKLSMKNYNITLTEQQQKYQLYCLEKLINLNILQINFTGNLDKAEGSTMFFIIEEAEGSTMFFIVEEAKETVLDFSKGPVKVSWFYFVLIKKWLNITS